MHGAPRKSLEPQKARIVADEETENLRVFVEETREKIAKKIIDALDERKKQKQKTHRRH